ncbi:MAG: PQQ-binding-like beta-propeller repeat protein [Candidatus Limnocylindrales bacterium]|jgi:outer membrane protein assembly factor BamB
MTPRFSVPALLVALAVIAAGCGSAAPSAAGSAPVPISTAIASVVPPATATAPPTPAPTPTPTSAPIAADWPVYHLDAARSGNQPAFPVLGSSLSLAWSKNLDGAVYAEPLVVGGRVIAATEGDTVYALNPANSSVLWGRNLGTPVPQSTLPCGDIDPLGITSTPAFDPASGSLFAVAEVTGPRHVLFALDPSSGSIRWSRDVDLPGDQPIAHQQRAALAVANGYVYIGFGGLAGDCGQYVGKVVGVPTSGAGDTIAYRVPAAREGAVWATAGPVIDAAGNLYVATGNGSSTTIYDGSDSVLELSPSLALLSRFAPSTWASENARDADLGSTSPVLAPGGWVFQAGKSDTGYVLRQGALGGIGGQVSKATTCAGFGGAALAGSTVYLPCLTALQKIQVAPDGKLAVGWTTPAGVGGGPPVIGGGAIWSVNVESGLLYAIDPATGSVLAALSTGPLPHFATPTLWSGLVLIGTMSGVTAITA